MLDFSNITTVRAAIRVAQAKPVGARQIVLASIEQRAGVTLYTKALDAILYDQWKVEQAALEGKGQEREEFANGGTGVIEQYAY